MEYLSFKIQELRRENNFSQEDLANKIGVSRQAISKWERNEGLPDLYNIKKLAEVFNVSVDELLEEKKYNSNENKSNKLSLILILIPTFIIFLSFIYLSYRGLFAPFGSIINIFHMNDQLNLEFLYLSLLILLVGTILVCFVKLYHGNRKQHFKIANIIIYSLFVIGYLLLLTRYYLEGFSMIFLYILGFLILISGLIGFILYDPNIINNISKNQEKFYSLTKKVTIWILIFNLFTGGLSLLTSTVLVERVNYCDSYEGYNLIEGINFDFTHSNDNSTYDSFEVNFHYSLDDLEVIEGTPYIEVYLDEQLIIERNMSKTNNGYSIIFHEDDYVLPIYGVTETDQGIEGLLEIKITYNNQDGTNEVVKSYHLNSLSYSETSNTFWIWNLKKIVY